MSIYQQYFALNCEPFSIVPDPGFLYPSSQHRQAVAHLKYGLDREGGFVLLTGEVGTGKTTLTRTLLKRLPAHVRVAYVLNSTLEVTDVLASICQELDIELPSTKDISLTKSCIDALNSNLIEAHSQGKKTLVVIEEAQNLSPQVLEILRLLSNLETATHKLLHILLVGQPELLETLAQKDQRQLNQRVVARFHLLPLLKSDVANYVNHRLHHAGANRAIFENAAMSALFKLTQGVPRLINLICHHALLAAYATGAKTISAKLVRHAAAEIFDNQASKPKSPNKGWIVAFAVLIFVGLGFIFYPTQLSNNIKQPSLAIQSANTQPDPVEQAVPLIELVEAQEVQRETVQEVIPMPPNVNNPYSALFARWSVEVEPLFSEEEVYALAGANELGVEKLTNSTIADLVALNRPGILWINEDDGRLKSYLLNELKSDSVSLIGSAGERFESIEWFASHWNGVFLYLWYSPSDILSLRLGDKDPVALDWLQSSLYQIDNNNLPVITGGLFNKAVQAQVLNFQAQQGIRADGVVGRQTIMHINQITNPAIPQLNVSQNKGSKI